ncbi:hypothetical protein [Pararhodobacter sp.]|uniref:ImuA family protein n=1 Tax=Pararhodobacter sp. TaxID=2127056 RepID=UPI002AFFFAF3|nr:hypothetical protein [Pararhodobacter sp.]
MDDAADSLSVVAKPDLATAARLLADLTASHHRDAGPVAVPLQPLPQMALARGRVHEIAGPARRTLAAVIAGAAQAEGPVLWLRPGWRREGLCPQGLARLLPDPGALIMVNCARPVDIVWSMEEALRAGCVALVVAEIAEVPDLRQVRRLHLAAGDGLARNRAAGRLTPAPLGVMLGYEVANGRVAGVESRWALHPLPPVDAGPPRWRLDRQLARGLPPKDWEVQMLTGRGDASAPLLSENA